MIGARPSAASAAGYVYFVGAIGGPIKIGHSLDPVARRRQLQVGTERKVMLLATMAGGRELEREFHRRFAASRLEGEHFAPTPELLALIWGLAGGELRSAAVPSVSMIDEFLAVATIRIGGGRVGSTAMFERFRRWSGGEVSISHKAFSMALRAAGLIKVHSNGMHWTGIALKDSADG